MTELNWIYWKGFPGSSADKESPWKAGDLGSVPGLGRFPRGGHGNPLQYSCLENPHGQRSLAGYSPWDTTEWLSTVQHNTWWSWRSNTLATWCEELTHWKRLWNWERLRAGGEGDDGGWDGCMGSPTQWTWLWVNSGSWWWTGRPDMLQSMGSQRVGHDWVTELNW